MYSAVRLPAFNKEHTYLLTFILCFMSCPGFISLRESIIRSSLVSKAQLSSAPIYLSDYNMRKPLSATSSRSLRSADWLDLFVPRTRTALAQRRAFAVVGPSTSNDLFPSLRAKLMTGFSSSISRSLKAFLFPRGFFLRAPLNSCSVRGAI